jgi:hypothetical protein
MCFFFLDFFCYFLIKKLGKFWIQPILLIFIKKLPNFRYENIGPLCAYLKQLNHLFKCPYTTITPSTQNFQIVQIHPFVPQILKICNNELNVAYFFFHWKFGMSPVVSIAHECSMKHIILHPHHPLFTFNRLFVAHFNFMDPSFLASISSIVFPLLSIFP